MACGIGLDLTLREGILVASGRHSIVAMAMSWAVMSQHPVWLRESGVLSAGGTANRESVSYMVRLRQYPRWTLTYHWVVSKTVSFAFGAVFARWLAFVALLLLLLHVSGPLF